METATAGQVLDCPVTDLSLSQLEIQDGNVVRQYYPSKLLLDNNRHLEFKELPLGRREISDGRLTYRLLEKGADLSAVEAAIEESEWTEEQTEMAMRAYLDGRAGDEIQLGIYELMELFFRRKNKERERREAVVDIEKKARQDKNLQERVRKVVCNFMVQHGFDRFEFLRYKVGVQNSSVKQEIVFEPGVEPGLFDPAYTTRAVKLDIKAIERAFKAGIAIPGLNEHGMAIENAASLEPPVIDEDLVRAALLADKPVAGARLKPKGKSLRIW